MSILIRGMKMPKDCPVCHLAHWDKLDRFTGCELKKRYFDKADMETAGRPSFCPLVELPAEHGRLIDEDAIYNCDMLYRFITYQGNWVYARKAIQYAPTIVEAEVSE